MHRICIPKEWKKKENELLDKASSKNLHQKKKKKTSEERF